MNLGDIFFQTITNQGLVSAISSSILVILVGWYFRKKGIFSEHTSSVLSKVLINASLPFLGFTAFMNDLDQETLNQGIEILVFGVALYILLILVNRIFFVNQEGDRKLTLFILSIFGSTNFFGIPIISAIFGDEGVIYANIFNIAYRLFLYTYAYIVMSGVSLKGKDFFKALANPTTVATVLGFIIWATQNYLPQVDVAGESYAFLRIDQTAYWLYRPMEYLASLASPVAWLTIGTQLAEVSLGDSLRNKNAWYYVFIKGVVTPTITLFAALILNGFNLTSFAFTAIATMVVLMATPASNTATTYAISFDRAPKLASAATFLSTLMAIIIIPLWMIVLQVLSTAGII